VLSSRSSYRQQPLHYSPARRHQLAHLGQWCLGFALSQAAAAVKDVVFWSHFLWSGSLGGLRVYDCLSTSLPGVGVRTLVSLLARSSLKKLSHYSRVHLPMEIQVEWHPGVPLFESTVVFENYP